MKFILIALGLLFMSCQGERPAAPPSGPDPAIERKHKENTELLAKTVPPAVVVSVSKIKYRTARGGYCLYDVKVRDKNGDLFIFAATDWEEVRPGDVLRPESIIVDGLKDGLK